jgi:hypothetical protein
VRHDDAIHNDLSFGVGAKNSARFQCGLTNPVQETEERGVFEINERSVSLPIVDMPPRMLGIPSTTTGLLGSSALGCGRGCRLPVTESSRAGRTPMALRHCRRRRGFVTPFAKGISRSCRARRKNISVSSVDRAMTLELWSQSLSNR